MTKFFALLLLAVLATGCVSTKIDDTRPDPVNITTKTFLAYSCPQPPIIDKFKARNITWDVISRKELDAVLLKLLAESGVEGEALLIVNEQTGDFLFQPNESVIWGLTTDEYAALSRNTSDILAAVRQQKAVINHYKTCIADSEAAVIEANANSNPVE